MTCNHEEHRLARRLRTEPLDRFDVDSIGGHYEVVWCRKCGAIKRGAEPWELPASEPVLEIPTDTGPWGVRSTRTASIVWRGARDRTEAETLAEMMTGCDAGQGRGWVHEAMPRPPQSLAERVAGNPAATGADVVAAYEAEGGTT